MRTSTESFSEEPVTAGNRPRVLVLNTDDVRRRLLANVLRKDGYEVVEKRAVADAVALFAEHVRAPDAVVGGGIALLVALRERGWATPVVLTERVHENEDSTYTADATFVEPIDVEAFRSVMLSLLWPRSTLPAG